MFFCLKNNRASGVEHVAVELLKHNPPVFSNHLNKANTYYVYDLTFTMRESLNHDFIIAIQKSNNPPDSCANLRTLTLLSSTGDHLDSRSESHSCDNG